MKLICLLCFFINVRFIRFAWVKRNRGNSHCLTNATCNQRERCGQWNQPLHAIMQQWINGLVNVLHISIKKRNKQNKMSNNEENTTLPNHVPMLEAGISHTVWKKAVLNLLMTRCPNAFKHVITGVEPKFAFPEIDVFTKVGRKEVTELAEVLASLTPDERALPVRDWDEPGPQFDTEDDHYYYRRSRHPDYAGPNGVIRHNFDF